MNRCEYISGRRFAIGQEVLFQDAFGYDHIGNVIGFTEELGERIYEVKWNILSSSWVAEDELLNMFEDL